MERGSIQMSRFVRNLPEEALLKFVIEWPKAAFFIEDVYVTKYCSRARLGYYEIYDERNSDYQYAFIENDGKKYLPIFVKTYPNKNDLDIELPIACIDDYEMNFIINKSQLDGYLNGKRTVKFYRKADDLQVGIRAKYGYEGD